MKSCPCKYEVINCSAKIPYWRYREVIFCSRQITWILENLEMLQEGKWPPEPVETGYVGGSGKKPAGNASFEKPASISGEVEKRIAQCAQIDGAMLYQQYVWGLEISDIAKSFHCSVEEVKEWVERALTYVSGWRRKQLGYKIWLKQVRHRKMTTIR